MLLKSGYDRSKKPEYHNYRELSFNEIATGTHVKAVDLSGVCWRNVKITSIKTWKRRPSDADVHWKYGLYEYGITEYREGFVSSGPVLVIEQ